MSKRFRAAISIGGGDQRFAYDNERWRNWACIEKAHQTRRRGVAETVTDRLHRPSRRTPHSLPSLFLQAVACSTHATGDLVVCCSSAGQIAMSQLIPKLSTTHLAPATLPSVLKSKW